MLSGAHWSAPVTEGMTPTSVARRVLARLWRDLGRLGYPIAAQGQSVIRGQALHSGSWGVALAYRELARDDSAWWRVAQEVASMPCEGYGRGLFSGPEGRAVLDHRYKLKPKGHDARSGDLIDGENGEIWSQLCLGGPRVSHAIYRPDVRQDDPGLAHGALGVHLPYLADIPIASLLSAESKIPPGGWCNGSAGLAAVALIAFQQQGDYGFLELAIRAVSVALKDNGVSSDGLCHGQIGVLAVAAGVARIAEDRELERSIMGRALTACRHAEEHGWSLEKERTIDHGWLTGVAGIAWGLLALGHRPIVNPLSPADSEFWASNHAETKSLTF